MKIEIFSVDSSYSNGRLRKNYIEKLKKYKVQEIKCEEYGSTRYRYFIKLNNLKDIFDLAKELGQQLIIDSDDDGNSITIYDDYIE